VEGILLVMAAAPTPVNRLTRMLEAGVRVVCVDRIPDRVPVDSVSVEDQEGAAIAVEHLLARGYRRIAAVTGPQSLKNERQRLLGYRQGLERAGVASDEDLIWTGNLRPADIAAMCEERLGDIARRPDAIFSTNGPTGLGVLRALRLCGLATPDDIGIVTFDELTADDLFLPAVTTIVQPAFEIGYGAEEILLDRIEGAETGETPVTLRMPATLKVRDSSRERAKSA